MAKQEDKYARRRLKTSYLSTVVSISLVLFTIGLLVLILLYAKKISNHVKENMGFEIFMKENVKEADILHLKKTLDASDYIKSTEYISKEDAAEIAEKELGENFTEFIDNPFPPSIDVRLKAAYINNDSIAIIEQNILANDNVQEVNIRKDFIHLINKNVKKISLYILIFSTLLLLIAFALINNTIRLSVYSKRFLIKSMQLVGATQSFIRKPFLLKGIGQGIIGAFLAILFLAGFIYLAQKEIPQLIDLQDVDLFLTLFVFEILMGIVISWISTYFAVRKYLKIKTDYLYFY